MVCRPLAPILWPHRNHAARVTASRASATPSIRVDVELQACVVRGCGEVVAGVGGVEQGEGGVGVTHWETHCENN